MMREIESPESGSAGPTPEKEVGKGGRASVQFDTREERTQLRSQREFHYPYNAQETEEPADRRRQALGINEHGEHRGQLREDISLGKTEDRPEVGILLRWEGTLAKNIDKIESFETVYEASKIFAEFIDAYKAQWAEKELAKLQHDTIEFALMILIGQELNLATKSLHAALGYGARKCAEGMLSPGIESINDVVTAARHAVTTGDLTELAEIRDSIARREISLALHVWSQFSFLHPRSTGDSNR